MSALGPNRPRSSAATADDEPSALGPDRPRSRAATADDGELNVGGPEQPRDPAALP